MQATGDQIQRSQKQFSKSDESAFSIVPSRLSSRISISTGQTSRPNSAISHVDMVYHRLSFENDLFTARVYKRNYRSERGQRLRRNQSDRDHDGVTNKSDSDNQNKNPSEEKPQSKEAIGETSVRRPATRWRRQRVAHGIMVTEIQTTSHTRTPTIEEDFYNTPTVEEYRDSYEGLVEACERGDNASVKRNLAKKSLFIFRKDPDSGFYYSCPVYAAVSNGHIDVLQTLISVAESRQGSFLSNIVEKPIGGLEDDRCRPIHVATMKRNLPMVKLLLERGAYPRAKTDFGIYVAHLAARAGSLETLSTLVEAGAETNCTDFFGLKPEDYATDSAIKEYLRQREDFLDTRPLSAVSIWSRNEDIETSFSVLYGLRPKVYTTEPTVEDHLRHVEDITDTSSQSGVVPWSRDDSDNESLL